MQTKEKVLRFFSIEFTGEFTGEFTSRFIGLLFFSILFFSTSCGTLYNSGPDFSLKITSQDNTPIVNLHCELFDTRLQTTSPYYLADSTLTNKNGEALLKFKYVHGTPETKKETEDSFCSKNFKIRIVDIDGSNNGGDFKTKTLTNISCTKVEATSVKMEKK